MTETSITTHLAEPMMSEPMMPEPMMPEPAVVARRIRETHDTFTLELNTPADAPFRFAPGQFNMLYPFGIGEVPISISGNPDEANTLIHTIRKVGLVTETLGALRKGDVVGVRGPFGNPWPVERAKGGDVLIIAGGIGLAPLRPAIYYLLQHRASFNRIVILYGARSPEDILFPSELGVWSANLDIEVFVTVDRATRDWHGSIGVITELIKRAPVDPASVTTFVCGPEIMMLYTVQQLHRLKVASDRIYVSMERNMKCGIGRCGHCQYGSSFVCKDGPVYRFDAIEPLFQVREL